MNLKSINFFDIIYLTTMFAIVYACLSAKYRSTTVIKYGSGIDGLSKGECNNKAIKEQFYGT